MSTDSVGRPTKITALNLIEQKPMSVKLWSNRAYINCHCIKDTLRKEDVSIDGVLDWR